MIAHVAEASEHSGRVLLWLDPSARCMSQALEASVHIAAAYGSELETIVVEAADLADINNVPVRRVATRGRGRDDGIIDWQKASDLLVDRYRRAATELAQQARVPVRHLKAAGDAIDRLAEMCIMRGPWNIIALSRAPSAELGTLINCILANVSGATGVVVAGREGATRPDRCIVVVVEDTERLPSMLRAADRLKGRAGRIRVILAEPTAAAYHELESSVRLAAQGLSGIAFETGGPTHGMDGALDEKICRAQPSLVIARFGGTFLSHGGALSRSLALAHAPFLLVR